MLLTKDFVNSCRKVGVLRDFLCQAIDQIEAKDRRIAKQKKKLLKAYGGKRLKELICAHAAFEELTISEMKKLEFDFYRDMKGGHHHRRNYCICSVCGKWFRRNKGRHYDCYDGTYHFCGGPCSEQAQSEADLEEDVGGGFCPLYWDDEGDAEWRRKK